MVGLKVELVHQLTIDRLDNLPNSVDALRHFLRQLLFLVGSGHGHQADVVALQKAVRHVLADVPLVSHSVQIAVFFQQFVSALQVGAVSRNQLEVQDHSTQRDKQLHLVPEDNLLFGGDTPETGSINSPLLTSSRHQMKLHHRPKPCLKQC